jgi:hypothetical protein
MEKDSFIEALPTHRWIFLVASTNYEINVKAGQQRVEMAISPPVGRNDIFCFTDDVILEFVW